MEDIPVCTGCFTSKQSKYGICIIQKHICKIKKYIIWVYIHNNCIIVYLKKTKISYNHKSTIIYKMYHRLYDTEYHKLYIFCDQTTKTVYSATNSEGHAAKSSRLPWRHLRRAAESNPRGPTCSSYLQPLKRVEKNRNKLLEIGILLIVYNKLIHGYDIYIYMLYSTSVISYISSWFIDIEI